ncbi:MAG: STAS domain-containing protein [Thermoleophilaceae bacterium]|jgi:anti-anti-sigma factor|nr:STAS domain-containing protein [Thermoleophilaceae bacterium]
MATGATEAKAKVHERGGVAVIELHGEINRSAEAVIERGYEEAAALGPSSLLLDFGSVDYINSTGIALIVGVLARARADGRTVRACGLSDHYREIFEITRLADFMTIHADEASALAEASG